MEFNCKQHAAAVLNPTLAPPAKLPPTAFYETATAKSAGTPCKLSNGKGWIASCKGGKQHVLLERTATKPSMIYTRGGCDYFVLSVCAG